MRTTIRLDEALLRQAKARAAANGITLNDFIADAVRAAVAPRAEQRALVGLPVFRGGRLLPGVDLDDTSALLDLMNESLTNDLPSADQPARAKRVAERPRKGR